MLAFQILFWASSLLVVYSYVLYPLLLTVFVKNKSENKLVFRPADDLPSVIIWMAVYNEEQVILQKLNSIFSTHYPMSKLQVWIGSDASSDGTKEIVESFYNQVDCIRFFDYQERGGKSGVLNKMFTSLKERYSPEQLEKMVLIPTDANVFFEAETIFQLVKHFANPAVGQVGANIQNTGISNDGISLHEKNYIQRENSIKYKEGLLGVMQGAFGGCYAIRASLWKSIPANFLMEDFFISMSVLVANQKAIFEQSAICIEDVSNEVAEEFKRKTRISAGNFQNLFFYFPALLSINWNSFCFWSHKGFRWLTPLFMLLAFFSSLFLIDLLFYKVAFFLQILLLTTPLIDKLFKRIKVHIKILRLFAYFYQMNLALANGFLMYLKGVKSNVWTPTKRNL